MKRLLYLIHRWAGIAVALFMAMWFVSGFVIMYAGPSALGQSQRLAHREVLNSEPGWLSLGSAWQISATDRAREAHRPRATPTDAEHIVSARLVRQGQQPMWLVEDSGGGRFALSALDGSLQSISSETATRIAAHWLLQSEQNDGVAADAPAIRYLDTGAQDSSVRNYAALRPFHRLAVGDAGRELLISARTGEVVRDSTPLARALYWTGNWIHLLRPVETIATAEARRMVQSWSGFIAAGASLTGLVIGWQRWRPGWGGRRTYSQGRVHPYRDIWNTWHFWVGLIGGSAAFLWAFSGYLNTNPGQVFSPAEASERQLDHYRGDTVPAVMLDWRPGRVVDLNGGGRQDEIVELGWQYIGGRAALLATTRTGERIPQAVEGAMSTFSDTVLLEAATRFAPHVPIAGYATLTAYDSYYYLRHHQDGMDRPLPVVRVELADEAGTHLYLDPKNGRLVLQQDTSRRIYRWLYSALHHWDFGWLYLRPVWDLWMLPLVLMGIVLGGSAVVLGWKRLLIDLKPKRKKRSAVARSKDAAHERTETEAV